MAKEWFLSETVLNTHAIALHIKHNITFSLLMSLFPNVKQNVTAQNL